MKEIELSNRPGTFAIVDDDDYEAVRRVKWSNNNCGYVQSTRGTLHRFVMKAIKGQEIDHINRNKLDNRKDNLRFCTRSENCRNRPDFKGNTQELQSIRKLGRGIIQRRRPNASGYHGVSKNGTKWSSTIGQHNKRYHLGCFSTAEEAARAYDRKAIQLYGKHAKLNFPE